MYTTFKVFIVGLNNLVFTTTIYLLVIQFEKK